MKIAITGHRPNKLGNDYDLTSSTISIIKSKIMRVLQQQLADANNVIHTQDHRLISGMALGIDQLFCQIAIEMGLHFIAAVPCQNQSIKWPQKSVFKYNDLIHKAAEIVVVTEGPYTPQCMQQRNEWMVDNCDLLIAIWDGSLGGTANCVRYAESKNKQIIRINPKEL